MLMRLPHQFRQASALLDHIETYDHQAYFVGGCVRDLLLNRHIGDIDIATSATPDVIQQIFSKIIPVGLEHGTVIVRYQHQSYEVTTFRLDGDYSDQRHPDAVQFVQTINQDLKRRDFTINAMAMDKNGNIIDPFNGREDLQKGIIRTVGNGHDRLIEDPLRIMRALRFSSQLGFKIEDETLRAMSGLSDEIETIAVERIVQEAAKFFAGAYVKTGMLYFESIGITNHLPILKDHPHIMEQIPKQIKPLKSFATVIAMFHVTEPGISIHQWAKQWKCSNKIKHEASVLSQALQHYQHDGLDRWLVYHLPANRYSDFATLVYMLFADVISEESIQKIATALPIYSKQDLAINGTELRRLFPDRGAGPWIGDILDQIEKQVVSGRLDNKKNMLKEWIKWNPPVTD
ncbi:CCA tRNA nucleotidyltransferase [Lentibacillus salinarum]|uniref:CCA-adding enzyme n=1 Tax=Lentibacillus salinarum TaxID=446820 RepID=A0ABW3ZQB3_9BACI